MFTVYMLYDVTVFEFSDVFDSAYLAPQDAARIHK